ncbi:NHLP family bacteriocin export ABC transporter permease/ATPase subunit [Gemmatimonadetes bacterium T265]|nr:NHLP family bacteriocin export ABC transporter permease/ATPase subunit [Gemmatimonadetes bacterium T265]
MISAETTFTPEIGPFVHAGPDLDVGGNHPFVLSGDAVWLVVDGGVDVFTVRVEGDAPAGARTHLLRAGPGDPLVGMGGASAGHPFGLLAVSAGHARIRRTTRERLVAHAAATGEYDQVAALVDAWITALSAGLAPTVPPQRCAEWAPDQVVAVAEPLNARPRDAVLWVRHATGHSYLLGRDDLEVNGVGPTPIGRHAWLDVREQCRVLTGTTVDALRNGALWAGLDRLHAIVLSDAEHAIRAREAEEHARSERRERAQRATLLDACRQMAGVLTRGARQHAVPEYTSANRAGVDGPDGDLFAACRLVAGCLGFVVRSPSRSAGGPPPRDPLAAVARASRFRTRTVALRDDWWRHDNGPLLAYVADGHRAVALVPAPGRQVGYVLHDPRTGTARAVTPAVADSLEPIADAFYRPFPDRAMGVRDVVRFGAYGCAPDLRLIVLMSVAAALLGLLPPVVTGALFNDVIPSAQRGQLVQLTAVLVVCAVATSLFETTRAVALLRVEGRMSNAVQSAIWDRLLRLPTSFFRPYTAGELAARAMGVDAMRQIISGTTVTAIVGGVFSLCNFGLLYYYSASLARWATLLIAVSLAVSMTGSWLQLVSQRRVYLLQSKASGSVLQLLSNVGKLRVANAEVQAFASWAERFAEQRRLQFRSRTVGNVVSAFNAAFPVVANIVIYYAALGLLTADAGAATLRTGDFLAFMAAFVSCLTNLIATSTALLSSFNVIPLYEQARPILTALPEVDEQKTDPGLLAGAIEVQHAHFRYQEDGPAVLRDVSLTIAPGEFVAFVGASGSGKSTMLRVLLGFERLAAGAVYYDGQDLQGLDVQAVRRQMGVVLQNGRLISGDLFTNIVGSNQATLDDAWEAARMAGLDEDIRAMPMGMHTVTSEGGGTLSGGQRQRLLIARAIVHRPRILLFDEATSALDNRTQAIVSASLERLQATRVVVAHRLSTILNADRICVFDHGQVVETGTYAELMERGGLFASLARRQIA